MTGTADTMSCTECVRVPYREYLTTLVLTMIVSGAAAFLVGYYVGMQIPREPTFGEKIYHNNAERSKARKLLQVCNSKD